MFTKLNKFVKDFFDSMISLESYKMRALILLFIGHPEIVYQTE